MARRQEEPQPHDGPRSQSARPGPFQRFFQAQSASGVLLLLSAAAALVAANSAWADAYHFLWAIPLAVSLPNQSLSLTLHGWINDGFMAVFFLLVGLEIKREFVAGELSSPRQAALPMAGAFGGMVLPAIVYLLFNHSGVEASGWGIPMATDIAFALGALTLIAPSIPVGAKVFLTALAIVDDMGAVLVIAVFYTHAINWTSLTMAALTLGALVMLNATRVGRLTPYLLLGVVLWVFVHQSGIHSTIAGVLLAFTIPTRTRINAADFSAEARTLLDEFERTETGDYLVLTSKGQQDALFSLGRASEAVTAPLLRLEQALQTFSAFVVMPLFAFSNAGVSLGGSRFDWSVALGIALGLSLGKPLGITLAAFGAVVQNVAVLPQRVTWRALHGCAWLGGIGFTMALFIANLAFEDTSLLDSAKVGILVGSFVSGAMGAVVLRVGRARIAVTEP
jgi:Na+:H+ antiporter, NhaA family